MARKKDQTDSPSTALALMPILSEKDDKRARKDPGPRDRRRWFQVVGKGMPVEEVAKIEGVLPITVQNSIDLMKEWRHRNSNENVALKVNELFISHLDGVSKVFKTGLGAKKQIQIGRTKAGITKFKDVPDVAMQLKTVETIKSLQELAQPKVPLVQTNQQFNTNVGGGNGNGEYHSGMSFESRIRMLREKRGMKNEEELEELEEADILGETSVEDELSDIGINLDEGDEESDADSA